MKNQDKEINRFYTILKMILIVLGIIFMAYMVFGCKKSETKPNTPPVSTIKNMKIEISMPNINVFYKTGIYGSSTSYNTNNNLSYSFKSNKGDTLYILFQEGSYGSNTHFNYFISEEGTILSQGSLISSAEKQVIVQ